MQGAQGLANLAQVIGGVHQNFQSTAPRVADTLLAAEGLALPGFWADKDAGLISLIALEDGGSSRLCAGWKPGERWTWVPTGDADIGDFRPFEPGDQHMIETYCATALAADSP